MMRGVCTTAVWLGLSSEGSWGGGTPACRPRVLTCCVPVTRRCSLPFLLSCTSPLGHLQLSAWVRIRVRHSGWRLQHAPCRCNTSPHGHPHTCAGAPSGSVANFLRMAKGEAGQGQFATPVGVYCAVWALLTAAAFIQASAAQAQRANARYRIQETRPRWVFSQVLAGADAGVGAGLDRGNGMAAPVSGPLPRNGVGSPAGVGSSPHSGGYSPLPARGTPGSTATPRQSPAGSRRRFWDSGSGPDVRFSPQTSPYRPGGTMSPASDVDGSFDSPGQWTKGSLVGTHTPSQ